MVEQFDFTTEVCRLEGAMQPHGLPVPEAVAEALRSAKVRRLVVRVNGYEIRRGLQGGQTHGSYLVVGSVLLKEVGVGLGDRVSVSVEPDPYPSDIELCDELLIALEQDDEANERWQGLTLGKQRSLAYHVSSAKREETRIKRALDIAMKLRTRTLHGDEG